MAVHLQGSGITPFNVWELEFRWWRIYRETLLRIINELKKRDNRGK